MYPTVDLTTNGNMTDLSDIKLVLDPLLAQAARFSEQCEIYAPLYRQVAFTPGVDAGRRAGTAGDADGGGIAGLSEPERRLALGDVRAAFKYYLDHFNNGPQVRDHGALAGLGDARRDDADRRGPDARRSAAQMISAILLGGGTTVAPGTTVNGTFKNIPTCTKPTDTGCMIAYSSFDVASPPGANSLFGKSPDGNEVACTNPGPLAGNAGPYHGSLLPHVDQQHPPRSPTPAPAGRRHAVRSLSRRVPGQLRHQERLQLPRDHATSVSPAIRAASRRT